MRARGKRGQIFGDNLIPWVVVIIVIILLLVVYGIYSGKLQEFISYFKDYVKVGR